MYNYNCIESKLNDLDRKEILDKVTDGDTIFYHFIDTGNKCQTISIFNISELSSNECNQYCKITYEDYKIRELELKNNIKLDICKIEKGRCKMMNCQKLNKN